MNIVVNRKILLDALRFGGAVAGKYRAIPILDCCKVSVKGDKMIVTSTDNEITIAKKATIVKSDVELYDFCVIPSDLIPILSTIRDEEIELVVDANSCVLNHSRGQAVVSVLPAIDFPTPTPNENRDTFTMDAQRLKDWLESAKNFVVVNSELRPALNGMLLCAGNGEVWGCSSDAFKLYMDGYHDLSFEGLNVNIIIPPKMFGYASSILSGHSSVVVQVDDKNVSFLVPDAKISARLIVGAYPKVRELLPKTFPIMVEVNTVDFADSVARMKLFADKNTNSVNLSFSSDGIKMVSSDTLTKKSCVDSCDVLMYDGEQIEVCTKTTSLENIVAKIESETFLIGLTSPKSAIVFYEADNKDKVLFTMPLLKNVQAKKEV